MGLLDNYTGIGMSPRPRRDHQRVMAKIMYHLINDFDDDFEVLSESCIDPANLNSQAPDIIMFDRETDMPVLFIEITTKGERKAIREKIGKLMNEYPTQEAFMYDYETKVWERFAERKISEDSYSDLLEIDLNELLP